ncbi:MAG: S4 domain-containing protein, partial [Actinobacteria bacterium]|nr:S4 domain-containing protein [Actinomycetota bacterium]
SLLGPPGASVADLLARSGLASSKTRARSILAQGGASVNNVRVSDPDALVSISDLLCDRYVVLRRGRRDYHLVRFG